MFVHLLGFSIAGTTLNAFLPPLAYPSPSAWGAIVAYLCGLGVLFWRGDGAARRTTIALLALAVAIYVLITSGRSVTYAMFNISAASPGRVARYRYPARLLVAIVP